MSYADLINIDDFWDKRDTFNQERWDVTFFCKDCNKIVETNRPDENWYVFICKICNWKNIAIWTQEWIKSNYRVK
jgi:hypothetical protein